MIDGDGTILMSKRCGGLKDEGDEEDEEDDDDEEDEEDEEDDAFTSVQKKVASPSPSPSSSAIEVLLKTPFDNAVSPPHGQVISRTNRMSVKFHSDRSVTGTGFSATWRKVIVMVMIKTSP